MLGFCGGGHTPGMTWAAHEDKGPAKKTRDLPRSPTHILYISLISYSRIPRNPTQPYYVLGLKKH